jgi:hypothetical protein
MINSLHFLFIYCTCYEICSQGILILHSTLVVPKLGSEGEGQIQLKYFVLAAFNRFSHEHSSELLIQILKNNYSN